ncbi:MAG: nitrilase-related carbon-nitrogen hydrolase [Candidatus Latescibacterota bacterium]|nr:nitrilase-related carbon-nitrogen hydrolase [Candidatus Latescibacterota bacterium]
MYENNELRYGAAACQVDQPNPLKRIEIARNTTRMLEMIDMAVSGYEPFMDIKLLVFPEFGHAAPVYKTTGELLKHLTVEIPNEHTELYVKKAKELGVYIQTATFLEESEKWPGKIFNSTCLIGPSGILSVYRKVNPWIPWEVHSSPKDVEGYTDDIFPVVATPIGKLGVAICYDWLFPEVLRQLTFNGAEVLIRVSAYMDPWGATAPMDWWTTVNRCRAIENMAYVVAANQGASLKNYAPFSWPGGSMVVDIDGKILAQADPGPGEKIVVSPIDINNLRHERKRRFGHQPFAHLRSEAYSYLNNSHLVPQVLDLGETNTIEKNRDRIKNSLPE